MSGIILIMCATSNEIKHFVKASSSLIIILIHSYSNWLTFQAVVLCQVERAKDAMLNQLYSSIRYILHYDIMIEYHAYLNLVSFCGSLVGILYSF